MQSWHGRWVNCAAMCREPDGGARLAIERVSHPMPNRNTRRAVVLLGHFLLLALSVMLLTSSQTRAEILCADDLVPKGMAITATGTAPSCQGACRAREVQPVCGVLMKICAGQPVPKGYVLDSVTTLPACRCLGTGDDAYVLRYVGGDGESRSSQAEIEAFSTGTSASQDAYSAPEEIGSGGQDLSYPYGNPPFGNFLCANVPANGSSPGMQPYGLGTQPYGMGVQQPGVNSFPGTGSNSTAVPQWNSQQFEPFRVGQ